MIRQGKSEIRRASVFLLLPVLIAGCTGSEEPAPSGVRPDGPLPEQQFYDYRLIETQAGVRQWILESDQMLKFSGQVDLELITVTMDFYKEGEHFSILTADSGRANLHTRDVFTWGDVVVITDDGRRLETEELYFDNTNQLIHNDVFNRFTRGLDVITGIGLEATPDLEYIEIKQRVEAEVGDDAPAEGNRP